MGCTMRMSIEIDDVLMADAMAVTGLSTKRETVAAALHLLLRRKRQAGARDLSGHVAWENNPDADRRDGADAQTAA